VVADAMAPFLGGLEQPVDLRGVLRKSLLRSWASVVDASLFTLRPLVAIGACLVSACICVR